jgi:hypothetical protein
MRETTIKVGPQIQNSALVSETAESMFGVFTTDTFDAPRQKIKNFSENPYQVITTETNTDHDHD